MRRRALLTATLGAATFGRTLAARADPGGQADGRPEVDVLLVLAVDVSRSVDEDEARLQRQGYAEALRDPMVHQAIAGGPLGVIGLAYLEWSGIEHQHLLAPWTRLGGPEDAHAFAANIAAAPLTFGTWTSISAAIRYARGLIAAAPFGAARKVIDVSGDGPNNSGPPAEEERDLAVGEGIAINGLPILKDSSRNSYAEVEPVPLDSYYRQSVAGGSGAFVLPAEDFSTFARAVRRKLVLEIAGLPPGGAVG
jgi:hypothetical protein